MSGCERRAGAYGNLRRVALIFIGIEQLAFGQLAVHILVLIRLGNVILMPLHALKLIARGYGSVVCVYCLVLAGTFLYYLVP